MWFAIGWEMVLGLLWFVALWWDRRNRSIEKWIRPEKILNWCMPVGRLLGGRWMKGSKRFQKTRKEVISLYPMAPPEEVWREYLSRKISQVYLVMILSGILLCIGIGEGEEEREIAYDISRPEYGTGDLQQVLIVREGEQEAQLQVQVPSKEPNAQQAESSLAEAREILQHYMEQVGTVREEVTLPVYLNGVEILYETTGDIRIDEEGKLEIVTNEEKRWQEEIHAVLSCGAFSENLSFLLIIDTIQNVSFYDEVEMALDNAELTEEALLLPRQRESGTEILHWYLPGSEGGVGGWLFLWGALPICVLLFSEEELRIKGRKRQRQIQSAYPAILQKLSVFLGAGLSIQAAWERIIETGDPQNPLIEEMRLTGFQMRNGLSVQEALYQFSRRMQYPPLKRMASMLSRDLRRGDEFLLDRLQEMNQEAWEEHKKKIRIRSEEAQTKLLLPMFLTLAAILVMVAAPAMMSMQI